MKILKSGIEMTPSQLRKLRGGACACGCEIGFNGELLNVSGDEDNDCECSCIGGPVPEAFALMHFSAYKNIFGHPLPN